MATTVRAELARVVQFLEPFLPLVNCHMVNFLTEDHWTKVIPLEIQREAEDEKSLDVMIDILIGVKSDDSGRFPSLQRFLQQSHACTLAAMDFCVQFEHYVDKDASESLEIKDFMSKKKYHEVTRLSTLVAALYRQRMPRSNVEPLVIDAGDGKGYLSSRLALEHAIPVLGIDSNPINTKGATSRSQKLQRAWNALQRRAENIRAGIPAEGRKRDESLGPRKPLPYRSVTCFIDDNLDLARLAKDNSPTERAANEFIITGLHTCGNLAPSCLRAFVRTPEAKVLCSVGCCYHLLDEETRIPSVSGAPAGFPMSRWLRERGKFVLGRNARMVASQSMDRVADQQSRPNQALFFRALLEVMLQSTSGPKEKADQLTVGKLPASSFEEYVEAFQRKFPGVSAFDKEETERYRKKFAQKARKMDAFYLFRLHFAPIVETIIILDRFLYLKENGVENARIVQVFDPVVSPRCYAIVAVK